jgi:hypothetical protein|nr:MAG TPA: hypothetical protein [Caudoviricetes sp.]
MSKEKPEIGDVWVYENHLYHISKIEDKEDGFGLKHKDACLCITKKGSGLSSGWYIWHILKKNGIYLGKSKANVNDLFEVKK